MPNRGNGAHCICPVLEVGICSGRGLWQQDDQSGQLVALLVIDSLSFLVAPMLSSAEANGHALMVCLGRMVKQIAQRFSLVALTTNHLVGGTTALCNTSEGRFA